MTYNGPLIVGDLVRLFYSGNDRGTGVITEIIPDSDGTKNRCKMDRSNGYTGWNIRRKENGEWGADGTNGHIELLTKEVNWIKIIGK